MRCELYNIFPSLSSSRLRYINTAGVGDIGRHVWTCRKVANCIRVLPEAQQLAACSFCWTSLPFSSPSPSSLLNLRQHALLRRYGTSFISRFFINKYRDTIRRIMWCTVTSRSVDFLYIDFYENCSTRVTHSSRGNIFTLFRRRVLGSFINDDTSWSACRSCARAHEFRLFTSYKQVWFHLCDFYRAHGQSNFEKR